MSEASSRRLIGIAGPPGSGKSTITQRKASVLGESAVVVPMDGFHFAQVELERRGLARRKGAPETFDVRGFIALLARIRQPGSEAMAPAFDREIEEPIAGAIAVQAHHETIFIEGNYLLHDEDDWQGVRALLDECWFVDVDTGVRRQRLLTRHINHGRSESAAREWMESVDEPNAELVLRTRSRADQMIDNTAMENDS